MVLRQTVLGWLLAGSLASGCAFPLLAADLPWPHWRGPRFDGVSTAEQVPLAWTPADVRWKVALPGKGQSSPALYSDRIYLTASQENGRQRIVFCLAAADGRLLWQHVAWEGEPEPVHKMNGWASASCATDGEVVVAFFGRGGLHGYTVDGKPLWSQNLGTFEGPWGVAACPILAGDLVIQNGDSDKDAFVAAFHRKTGREVWRTKRPDHRGWSTPIVLERNGRQQVVLNGHAGVTAYDLQTGQELWFAKNANGRGEPTVTPAGDLLFVVCGLSGNMSALRLAGDGSSVQSVWTAMRRGGRDLPSPIVVGKYLIVCALNGIVTCYDTETGREYWKERLPGQFSSSPIAVQGKVLLQNEAGETTVVEPGATFQVVQRNSVGGTADELFRASLTPTAGRMYSRSDQTLYCIGK